MNLNNLKKLFGIIIAVVAGGLAGFYIVMGAVFTDFGGKLWERIVALLLVILVYSIMGFVFGNFGRETGAWWGAYLSLPAISFLLVYMFRESGMAVTSVIYILAILTFSTIFAHFGSKVKFNRGGDKR